MTSIKVKIAGFVVFAAFAILFECVTMNLLGFGFLPTYLSFDVAFLLMIGAVFVAIPSVWVQFVLEVVFLLLQVAIALTNLNLQAITGETFLWEMLFLVDAAEMAMGEDTVIDFTSLAYFVPLLFAFFVLRIAAWRHLRLQAKVAGTVRRKARLRAIAVSALAGVVCYGGGFLLKTIAYARLAEAIEGSTPEEVLLSPAYLYETLMQGDASIKTFGNFTYYAKSSYLFLGIQGDAATSASILDAYFEAGMTADNAYTGISAGNNLIVILMESYEYFAIDYYFTPNLYRLLYQDAVWLENYHAKNKTDVSEAFSIFGSYPARGSLYFNYLETTCPFTLPNMLRANTDITAIRSFHNNTGTFYNRSIAHPAFGFDEHVDASMMDLTEYKFWVRSDEEMMLDQLDAMIPEDDTPFFTYITSFVMHGGYNKRSMFKDTYAYFDEIGYFVEDTYPNRLIRTYMAAAMDFDRAIGALFDRLAETGHLEDTTVVMFADHQAYYYGLNYYIRGVDPNIVELPRLYRLPALIYDTKLKAYRESLGLDVVSKFITTVDLVPTILNLFDVPYNPNMYVGYDIFGQAQSVVISKTGGIFNDQFYTSDGVTRLWQDVDADELDWAKFQSEAARSLERTNHLNLVYAIDYFGLDGDS